MQSVQLAKTAPIAYVGFVSNEYDDRYRFRTEDKNNLQRLSAKLTEIKIRIDAIGNSVDEFQVDSFQYNVKIVSVREKPSESTALTSKLSLKLFKENGK